MQQSRSSAGMVIGASIPMIFIAAISALFLVHTPKQKAQVLSRSA